VALHIKKGDMVQIIAGDHKGATGRVLHVYPDKRKVLVQGHNIAKCTASKYKKLKRQQTELSNQ
jgi:ribosomal protein L24